MPDTSHEQRRPHTAVTALCIMVQFLTKSHKLKLIKYTAFLLKPVTAYLQLAPTCLELLGHYQEASTFYILHFYMHKWFLTNAIQYLYTLLFVIT